MEQILGMRIYERLGRALLAKEREKLMGFHKPKPLAIGISHTIQPNRMASIRLTIKKLRVRTGAVNNLNQESDDKCKQQFESGNA